jgi:hypothetical protein
LSLAAGAILLVVLGRDQWFAYDDWAILHPDTPAINYFGAHQGHWNTAAAAAFQLLRATVGFHSYLPYLALAILAHLAVVHLIWRVMGRAGIQPWLATALAGILIVLGSATENLMWAFQFGFMGAIAVGLVALLLADRPVLRPAAAGLLIATSVVALMFSGTALPLLASTFVVSVVRRGWIRSMLLLAPALAVYLVWYLVFAFGAPSPLAPHGMGLLTQAPVFFGAMFAAAYGQFLGFLPLGVLAALGLALWTLRRFRTWTGGAAAAYALLLGSVVFALLTTISRSGGELSAAGSQRYVYVMVVLATPVLGLALTAALARTRLVRVLVVVLLVAAGVVNAGLLVGRSAEQAAREQRVQREVSAALELVAQHPGLDGRLQPVIDGAPDIVVDDLRDAIARGLFSPVPFTAQDEAVVRRALGL